MYRIQINFPRMAAAAPWRRHVLLGKTSRTITGLIVLALIPYLIPTLARFRAPIPSNLANLVLGRLAARVTGPASITESVADTGATDVEREAVDEIANPRIRVRPGEIEDPSQHALDHFFASLLESEIRGGQVRVCHYGDSPITNDGITSTIRLRLQQRFGDAGHGFVLIDKPWGWYAHAGVAQSATRGWHIEPMFISKGDHLFGLGGASFTAEAAGVSATLATSDEPEAPHSASAFEVYYLAQPGGGDLDVLVDGQPRERLSTSSAETKSGFFKVQCDEATHEMTLRVVGNGAVRLFGVVLESRKAGIQYDSLGVNGAFIGLLAHYLDAEHWADQLRHRKPALVIIGYGTNESQFEKLPMNQYEQDTREAIRRVRAALPGVSIMLLGPMDRGQRGAGGAISTRPMIPKLVSYQRRIAAETGCAFFDTFSAMGGEGTVARWLETHPKLMGGDYTHPTAQGAEKVGSLIYDALMKAYEEYKSASQTLAAARKEK